MKYRLLCLLTLFLLTGCRSQEVQSVQKSEMLFDTIVSVELYGTADEALLDACFDLGRHYENMLSRTVESSEIYELNHADGAPVTVSDETVELLEKGIYYGVLTDGAFDISIAAVTDLWDFSREHPVIPEESLLTQAVSTVGSQNILIDGNTVTLPADMQIDLGGIAKGYIADQMKDLLQEHDISSAVLNLGGDVVTIGTRPDKSKWNIGIQKPFDEQNRVIAAVSVQDLSVVSSGSYERYFELDNYIYHHILDTKTGFPVNNSLTSVTVISDYGIDGDCLSTAAFALGLDEGMRLINSLDNTEAVFITEDNTLHYSDGIGTKISVTETEH